MKLEPTGGSAGKTGGKDDFVNATNTKDGDLFIILNEGKIITTKYGDKLMIKVRDPQGAEKLMTLNKKSQNMLIKSLGEETSGWIKKIIKAHKVKMSVSGKLMDVLYITEENQDLED